MLSEFELVFQQQSNRLSHVLEDGKILYPGNGEGLHYYAFIIGKVKSHYSENEYRYQKEPNSFQIIPFLPERITSKCRIFVPEVVSMEETSRKPQRGDIALFVTKGNWFGERKAVMLFPPVQTTTSP